MEKQPAVAQMFRYYPGAINLIGFPISAVLDRLSTTLGQEILLRGYQSEFGRKKLVIPSFSLEYVQQRQDFFQGLPETGIERTLFEGIFPKTEDAKRSTEGFLDFCETVYETMESAKKTLKDFRHIPEAGRIHKRLDCFDSDLEQTLRALKAVDESYTFAIDSQSGVIVPIDKMPDEGSKPYYREADKSHSWERQENFERVKMKMKKAVFEIANQGKTDFRRRIMKFVRDEFRFDYEIDNIRRNFEQLAVPVRLYMQYKRFLERFQKESEKGVEDISDEEDLDSSHEDDSDSEESKLEIPSLIYPRFGNHYEIKNLFPLSLLSKWGWSGNPVPIDFRTKSSEKKFLLAGLHSGGKSFFLENIVLASILGQMPLDIPADTLVAPKYKRIFYYRNTDNGGRGDGKLVGEIGAIDRIINQAEKGDLLVFDEFLDSTTSGIATWLVPELLGRLGRTDATVFVSTHRNPDYKELEKNGWVTLSPEYKIKEGRVTPTHRLKRGRPDERANRRFVRERYESVFTSGE